LVRRDAYPKVMLEVVGEFISLKNNSFTLH